MSRGRSTMLWVALALSLARPAAPGQAPAAVEMRPDAVIVKLRGAELGDGSALEARLAELPESVRSAVFPELRRIKALDPELASLARIERLSFRGPVDVLALSRELARLPQVEYAEPVYLLHATAAGGPNDPLLGSSGAWGQGYRDLWGLQTIGAAEAWKRATGAGVRIAIVDTGSDLQHPELVANLWKNPREVPGNRRDDDGNGLVDDVFGWDFENDDANPSDDNGHGTHVAGTAAAVGDNRMGIAGVAWRARVMTVKALDENGTGETDRIARGITYAALSGARVVNMSFGGAFSRVLEDALAAAHARGVVLVAAAGNANADAASFHPASSRFAITVGAANRNDGRAPFSNFGAGLDLLAPGGDGADLAGTNVLSLRSSVLASGSPAALRVGDRYLRLSGTSMAAPHVAGAAALLLEAQPGLTPEEVRQALRRSSRDVAAAGWDRDSGYGRLAVAAAVAGVANRGAARFLAPRAGAVLTSATAALAGIAGAARFQRYDVEIGAGAAPTSWTLLASSQSPVARGRLATLWTAGLSDGPYLLRLTVVDRSGVRFEDRLAIAVDRVRITSPVNGEGFRTGDVVAVTGTAAAGGFRSFEVQYLEPGSASWSGRGVALAGDGRAPVENGLLASWDTTGLPRGYYRLRLVVHRDGGADQSEEVTELLLDPAIHRGWPRPLSDTTPTGGLSLVVDQNTTVADLDGDGRLELLLAQGEQVQVLRDDGTPAPGWPQSLPAPEFVTHTQRSPSAADLDGDGRLEVIVPTNSSHLFVFAADGVSRTPDPPQVAHDAAAADVLGDARPEIATTSSFMGGVWLLDAALKPLPGWPKRFPRYVSQLSPPVLADLDGDGKAEVVFTEGSGPLVVYAYRGNGTSLAGFPRTLAPDANIGLHGHHGFQPAAGDVDGDGRLEIVTGTDAGQVFVVGADGRVLPGWPVTLPAAQYSAGPASLGDFDGDGAAEIVIGAATRVAGSTAVAYALDGHGRVLPGWPIFWGAGVHELNAYYGFGTAAIADVDGDGARDVVIDRGDAPARDAAALDAYSSAGQELPGFPFPTGTGGPADSNTPAVIDLDGDGFLEVVWINDDGFIFVWDLDAPAAGADPRRGWPMFRHDAAHTGTLPVTKPVAGKVPP